MKYISPREAAERWGISQRRVHALCDEGRIKGAVRHSRVWLIPETAEKPEDARVKSGRYLKSNSQIYLVTTKTAAAASQRTQPETEEDSFLIPSAPNTAVLRSRLIEK